jgi:hypothetical protein
MRPLLLIALLSSACMSSPQPPYSYQVIRYDRVEDLESAAAEQFRCPDGEIESRQLTLLTRLVWGCGHERIYAWDEMRGQWVLDTVEKP